MRVPVPNNKLVAFTLAGALLTAIVAGALATPDGGLTQFGEQADPAGTTASDASQQLAADAPTPNQDFTPAVQTQTGYEDEEHEDEYEEEDEHEEHEEEG
ncbi:hypothetical protein [Haladaptatus sp. NG-SE-30]